MFPVDKSPEVFGLAFLICSLTSLSSSVFISCFIVSKKDAPLKLTLTFVGSKATWNLVPTSLSTVAAKSENTVYKLGIKLAKEPASAGATSPPS